MANKTSNMTTFEPLVFDDVRNGDDTCGVMRVHGRRKTRRHRQKTADLHRRQQPHPGRRHRGRRLVPPPVGRRYIEVGYADVRRPRISLWEQRAACHHLRAEGQRQLSEALIFKAIEQQRRIVDSARQATRVAQRQVSRKEAAPLGPWSPTPAPPAAELDYSQTPDPFPVEIWDSPWPKTA